MAPAPQLVTPSLNDLPALVKELGATAHPNTPARPPGAQKASRRSKTGAWAGQVRPWTTAEPKSNDGKLVGDIPSIREI